MRINQNIAAFNSYRNLSMTNTVMGKSLEKLSSGFRINRAADDAAGLVISQGLRAQVSGLRQATRNAQDGISVVQTAEGALNEVHAMLNRMRDLAVQSVNASNDSDARIAANNEIDQLKEEIGRIADTTKFGSQKLLDGSFGGKLATALTSSPTDNYNTSAAGEFDFTIHTESGDLTVSVSLAEITNADGDQVAAALQTAIRSALDATGDADYQAYTGKVTVTSKPMGDQGSSIEVKVDGLEDGYNFTMADTDETPLADLGFQLDGGSVVQASEASGKAALFQVGANKGETIKVKGMDLATIAGDITGDVLTADNAADFIEAMDSAITDVSAMRGELGAVQNRFESTINNLQVTTENLAASESRIRDTDMALEMVSFTRHQILLQAGTAMLGQANQLPQSVLGLLR